LLSAVPEIVPSSLATFARGWNLFRRILLCRWNLIEQYLLAFHSQKKSNWKFSNVPKAAQHPPAAQLA
jgi:hypothetical protein